MSKSASVTTIWSVGLLDGERVRICTGNGVNRIIVGGFDIHVPGKFNGDPNKVLAAYTLQVEELNKAFSNLPDNSEQSPCSDDNYGLIPISDHELEEQIREFKKQCKVISMKTRKSI